MKRQTNKDAKQFRNKKHEAIANKERKAIDIYGT